MIFDKSLNQRLVTAALSLKDSVLDLNKTTPSTRLTALSKLACELRNMDTERVHKLDTLIVYEK